MDETYHPQTIQCRHHEIRLSLKTGNHKSKLKDMEWFTRPHYVPGATCPEFNLILEQQFSLCLEPEQVIRHFWECAGYMACPSRILPIKVAFYGSDSTAKNQIASLLLPMVEREKSKYIDIVSTPPDRVHSDFDIANTTAIPFHNVYHKVSEIPAYAFDRINEQERSGILNEALAGIKRLIKRGHLDPPKDCIDAATKYLRTVDHVGAFLRDKVVIVDDDKVRVSGREMFNAYLLWSTEPKMTLSRIEMVREMTARGYKYSRAKGANRDFIGVALIK